MSCSELRALVEAAQRGEPGAFDRAVALCREELTGSVRARLYRHGLLFLEPQDIIQETLMRAFTLIERFRWTGESSFEKWIHEIARRVILSTARRERRRRKVGLEEEHGAKDVSPSRSLRREERSDRLRAAIESLSEPEREVILLARVQGLTLREVADRTGRSHAAVRQMVSRALKKLRHRFGETESLSLGEEAIDFDRPGPSEQGTP